MASRKKTGKSRREDEDAIVGKAAVYAAQALGLTHAELSGVIGVSPDSVSRMADGTFVLSGQSLNLAVCLVDVARSLDALAQGDHASMKAWMANHNMFLDAVPREELKTAMGLVGMVTYLDGAKILARFAPVDLHSI